MRVRGKFRVRWLGVARYKLEMERIEGGYGWRVRSWNKYGSETVRIQSER